MREYCLLEIDNLKLPEEGRISRSRMRCILDAITCIVSEYAIGCLGYDVSDETLYPFIRKYFAGELGTKDMLKRLLKNYEIEEFFSILPGLDISFDDPSWKESLSKIYISSEKENFYRLGKKSFRTEKLFFSVDETEGNPRAQKYYKEPGEKKAVFIDLEIDSKFTDITDPYQFIETSETEKIENEFQIEDEDFFTIDEIKSADVDQRKAIRASTEKNLVVLAGAGSGKTRTLVSRLAYLHLVKGVPLSKIVLLTFTTSAADEMSSRAESLIKQIYQRNGVEKQPYVYAKTFDAFFRRILLDYFGEIGFTSQPNLDLMASSAKKIKMLREVISENQMQRIFTDYISDEKRMETLLGQMESYANGLIVNQPGLDRLMDLFLEKQIEQNTVLGFQYVNLLVKRSLYQEGSLLKDAMMMRYSCFLIDEFQDISSLQNETMRLFYNTKVHFTFVGDDDQSIYAWRGADVSIIRDIVSQENTQTLYLLVNYRNNPNIVKAGNCILRLLENRAKHKEIIPYKTSGAKICVSKNDAKFINVVDEIDRLIKNGTEPKEISVLARKKKQASGIEDALRAVGVPVASQKLPATLDNYYYLLKALINIQSDYSIYSSCRMIKKLAKEDNISENEVKKIIRGEQEAAGNMAVLQDIALDIFRPGADQLSVIVERYAEKAGEEFGRLADGNVNSSAVEAFTDLVKDQELPWPVSHNRLASTYAAFERVHDFRNMNRKMENGVSVNTIHSAKGLEYNIVMIVGLDQGEYPDIGIIENEYNRKVQELERLKNARSEYDMLRRSITDEKMKALLSDCGNKIFSDTEAEKIEPLKKYIEMNLRGLRNLSANALEDFMDEYSSSIVTIERSYSFDQAQHSRKILEMEALLSQRKEELLLLDEGDEEIKEAKSDEIDGIEIEIKKENEIVESLKKRMSLFEKAIANIKSFNNNAHIASGLLADMSRAEEIGAIKKKLEMEKKVKIEERRTFYVAVTRARDQLYLFTDEGATESEFVKDISDDLKTEYAVLTRSARIELERMAGLLRREFEKEILDDDSIDTKIRSIVSDEKLKEKIEERYREYLKLHSEYASIPSEAERYFRHGMSLIFVGELTGMEFSTEFAHNMQKAAERILWAAAGEKAVPFVTKDRFMIDQISTQIRKDVKALNTQIPSRHFVEVVISSEIEGDKMDSLKKAAIQHYIVRSHRFKVKKEIYSTWGCQKLAGNPEDFLKAALGLSNMRNVLVHQSEEKWPEDPVTAMLLDLRIIIEAGYA